ncbi:RNA polymerase alpha subunit C-terminal domain-containing protein [Paenibacillus agaridevorans]|uniref:RNA polymerase alpha subunit C-terminal domain-containing protein n=1 Tax=Paenibacillus agaridevorans TaxID=171404 RepID=UPI001BE3EA5C|nr:RNA polymerase alpha subunit C-terminal domain-containing protein [Paenibacillus agaridevorans]
MVAAPKTLRICEKGHRYYKSSECNTCPKCESGNAPETGFMTTLAAPVRRALETEGISTLSELSAYSEKEILKLHGVGPSCMPILREALREEGLSFKS